MMIRWIGAICIVAGSGFIGLFYILEHFKTTRMIRQLVIATKYIERELRYRQLAVPELLLNTADYCGGILKQLFTKLVDRINMQQDFDISASMDIIIQDQSFLPEPVKELLRIWSKGFGHFDLQGQLEGLEEFSVECKSRLETLTQEQGVKMRSYQTLALCTGAAVAILLI